MSDDVSHNEQQLAMVVDEDEQYDGFYDDAPPAHSHQDDDDVDEGSITPSARDHSYLPGAAHPLFPESQLFVTRNSRRCHITSTTATCMDDKDDGFVQVPLLILPGVVLFPGDTIPLRLSSIELQSQINQARSSTTASSSVAHIVMGILTHVIPRARQRNSWMRTNVSLRNSGRPSNSSSTNRMVLDLHQLLQEGESDEEEEEQTSSQEDESHEMQEEDDDDDWGDPLIGRIGTMVTITNTHGDFMFSSNNDSSSSSNRSQEIVVTALGTNRFRVVKPATTDSHPRNTTTNAMEHYYVHSRMKWYRVQEFNDQDLPLPRSLQVLANTPSTTRGSGGRYQRVIHQLATVSPLPPFVYARVWPWKLVQEIRYKLHVVGLLPTDESSASSASPSSPNMFSFWLASNMPLAESEKLHLLEMNDTLKRLHYLHDKIMILEEDQQREAQQQTLQQQRQAQQQSSSSLVCCKRCNTHISAICNMFTVGGADGTTGAYVNEYGIIHQTMTFSNVIDSSIAYSGGPETRASWFPGYSWTIAYCRRCHNHLGWKFCRATANSDLSSSSSVARRQEKNRPQQFWGLSARSITTTL